MTLLWSLLSVGSELYPWKIFVRQGWGIFQISRNYFSYIFNLDISLLRCFLCQPISGHPISKRGFEDLLLKVFGVSVIHIFKFAIYIYIYIYIISCIRNSLSTKIEQSWKSCATFKKRLKTLRFGTEVSSPLTKQYFTLLLDFVFCHIV